MAATISPSRNFAPGRRDRHVLLSQAFLPSTANPHQAMPGIPQFELSLQPVILAEPNQPIGGEQSAPPLAGTSSQAPLGMPLGVCPLLGRAIVSAL